MSRPVLVTGAAGFIGAAVCERLLARGERVVGIDNLNSYYDPALKQARLSRIEASAPRESWSFQRLELEDGSAIADLFARERPRLVIHLAAQAGVRYSRKILVLTCRPTWWGLAQSSKAAATTALCIWCTPPVARCMAATPTCRSRNISL